MEERKKKLGPQAIPKNFKKISKILSPYLAVLRGERLEKMGEYGEMGKGE